MRITLIRTLGIAMLAASISGFAQTIDVKNESTAITPASTQQNVSEQKELNQLENDYKANDEEKKKKIDRDDKQWNTDLMGIHG
ncbi:MAG: hypothetical protein JWM08_1607 [Candidatus Angelobacter sp.]|nr:hypothetical protein [Candidatus Angelobacter sp.]